MDNCVWAPTCFGNITAREFVFSRIHAGQFKYDSVDVQKLVTVPSLAIAYAGLIVAAAGDASLLDECGFATDCIPQAKEVDTQTLERLRESLVSLKDESQLLQYWKRRKRSQEFRENLDRLIQQLALFPKCTKSKFAKMTKKELSRIAEEAGENFFDGPSNSLSVSKITPKQILEMGRFRGVESINFLPLTNAKSANSFDLVVKFAIQNWSTSLTRLNFGCIGTLDGDVRFEFPEGIESSLRYVQPHIFEATGFVATDEILSSILGDNLQVIRLGNNRLTPRVFDLIDASCKNLQYFFIERSFSCTKAFVRRAAAFQLKHMQTKMVLNGLELKTLHHRH